MNHSEPSPTGGSYWLSDVAAACVCWLLGVGEAWGHVLPNIRYGHGNAIRWAITPITMVSNHVFGGCIEQLGPFGTFSEGQAMPEPICRLAI